MRGYTKISFRDETDNLHLIEVRNVGDRDNCPIQIVHQIRGEKRTKLHTLNIPAEYVQTFIRGVTNIV